MEAANALEGMANGLEALYRIKDPDGRLWDEFYDLGVAILELIADAIEAATAQVGLLLELIAESLQLRLPIPPEPRDQPAHTGGAFKARPRTSTPAVTRARST